MKRKNYATPDAELIRLYEPIMSSLDEEEDEEATSDRNETPRLPII